MYTTRVHNFSVKNTSLIAIKYSCKIVKATDEGEMVDPGYFYIAPKVGTLSPNCDENFTVKFSPTEVDEDIQRFLVVTIDNL